MEQFKFSTGLIVVFKCINVTITCGCEYGVFAIDVV